MEHGASADREYGATAPEPRSGSQMRASLSFEVCSKREWESLRREGDSDEPEQAEGMTGNARGHRATFRR